jgi:DNA mismatch repair protein MutL
MNPKISRLSESVINQIAAGEVVENPASIVKELIENSLDAGAKCIRIEIVGGGQQLIRIEDDGCGMSSDDALLSLERHATSKIRSVDDLQSLSTMGFRGEALAAISSVSYFEIKTCDGSTGTRVVAQGGIITNVEPCARNRGTTIEVRSLFYNVPARKKFQKSPTTNGAQVTRVVENIALAHPEISFFLNGREFAPSDQKGRIEEILGEHEHELKGQGIFGYAASPGKAQSNRTGQYVFINKRPVFCPLISKAVKEGFGTRIGEHAYPRFVIFLDVPPDSVDVNVHPQKREVRFRDEGFIFRSVQQAVLDTFSPRSSFQEPISFTMPKAFSFAEAFPAPEFRVEERSLEIEFSDRPLAVLGSYFLLQNEELILVDLKAAHARVFFETIKHKKESGQALIWPLEIPLEKGDEERAEALNELGIECRILKRTLFVDALPPFLDPVDFSCFFAEWKKDKKLDQIVTRFCRSVRKNFSMEQAVHLWKQVKKCSDGLYDPSGNLISRRINEENLAKILKV